MNCDVMMDLLPLYAEGMLSEASRKLVEEHLDACPNCGEVLKDLQAEAPRAEAAALPLEKISRGLKMKRVRAGLLVLFLLLAFVTAAFSAFTTPRYAPYTEQLFSIREIKVDELLAGDITQNTIDILAQAGILGAAAEKLMASGDDSLAQEALRSSRPGGGEKVLPDTLLEITFAPGYGASLSYSGVPDGEDGSIQSFELQLYSYPFARVENQGEAKMYTAVEKGKKAAVYYLEPDRVDRLVYGPDPLPNGGRMTLPRLALAYYVMLALALAVLIAIPLFFLRKKEKPRRVLILLLGMPLSWAAGHLLIRGFTNVSWEIWRDMGYILATAVFLFAAWLIYWRGRPERPAG